MSRRVTTCPDAYTLGVAEDETEDPAPKDINIDIRADPEQIKAAKKRLKGAYSLSALIRALIEKWLDQGSDLVNADDLERHSRPAPKGAKKKKTKKQ